MKAEFTLADFITPADIPGDHSAAARRFLEGHADGGWKLTLAAGIADVYPEAASEAFLNPSNNDRGNVRSAFLLQNLHDIEIDGNGATLMMRGAPLAGRGSVGQLFTPPMPFVVDHCSNVVIRNLAIDWRTPFVVEGIVRESQPKRLVVEMTSPQKWWTWNGHMYVEGESWTLPVQRLLACSAETGAILPGTGDNFGNGFETNWQFTRLSDSTVELRGEVERLPPAGSVVLFWLAGFNTGGRRCPGVFINESSAVTLDNVTIHHAWGMGVIAQRSRDITITNSHVVPSAARHFTLTADATHFVSCRGQVRIENCTFQNQFDDAVNLHGNFLQVVRALGVSTVRVRTGHPQHEGVPVLSVGDTVEWLAADTLEVLGTAQVVSLNQLNAETTDVTVNSPVPGALRPGDVLENCDWYPDVTIRGCTFRWNRARGVLLNGRGKIVIENTVFQNPGSAVLFETSPVWCESGRTRDVTIQGNTVDGCCTCPSWGSAAIMAAPEFGNPQSRRNPFHDSIAIRDNTFKALTGPAVAVNWTRKLTVTGNRFEPAGSGTPAPLAVDAHTAVESDVS